MKATGAPSKEETFADFSGRKETEDMDIVEAVKNRMSIRAFKLDPVSRDILSKILEQKGYEVISGKTIDNLDSIEIGPKTAMIIELK